MKSEEKFFELGHDDALEVFVFLRSHEQELEHSLEQLLRRLERRLFAAHSIEEMEHLVSKAQAERN